LLSPDGEVTVQESSNVKKPAPTIFPLGFGIGQAEDGNILIVEFYDNSRAEPGELTVIGSYALTAKKASDLARAIIDQASNQEKDE
jgi:hypothetical protein